MTIISYFLLHCQVVALRTRRLAFAHQRATSHRADRCGTERWPYQSVSSNTACVFRRPDARSTFAAPLAGPTVAGVARLYFSLVPPAAGHRGGSKCRRAAQIPLAGRPHLLQNYHRDHEQKRHPCFFLMDSCLDARAITPPNDQLNKSTATICQEKHKPRPARAPNGAA